MRLLLGLFRFWLHLSTLLLLALAGCTRPAPEPPLQINFSPDRLRLVPGGAGEVNITLVRQNLPGVVALDLPDPLPEGVTASFTPSSTSGDTATLRVQTSSSAAVGSFNLRVRAAQGSVSAINNLPLQIESSQQPDLQLFLDNRTPSIRQGQHADLLVDVRRINLEGVVVLALEQQDGRPLPPGLSATFSPGQPSTTVSILRLAAAPTATTGPYPLRIKATWGSLERTLDFTLTVLEALPEPDFQLNLTQNLSLQRGGTSSETITITRVNLSGPIALSLERFDGTPLPPGISATFAPAEPEGSHSTLTISAAPDLPLGDYVLRVRGVQGTLERTALVLLNVFDQADLTATGAVWVAAQDDSGAWQVVQPTAGSYRLRISNAAERYGWAAVCSKTEAGLTTHQVSVYQLTLSEVRTLSLSCPPAASSGTFSDLSGQLTNLDSRHAQVAFGTASDFVDPARTADFPPTPAYPGYLLQGVRQGTADLMAVRYLPPTPPGTYFQADRALFQRSYTLSGRQTLDLDMQGPASFALEGTYTATLTNPNPAAQGLSYLAYLTPTTQTLYLADSQQQAADLTYSAIPTGRRLANEFYVFYARETTLSNLSLRSRQALRGFANPQNLSASFLSLPEAHLNLQNNRFQTTWSPYSWSGSGSQLFSLQLEQLAVAPNTNLVWHLHLSRRWVGGTTSYPIPNLAQSCAAAQSPCVPAPSNTATNGWQSDWSLRDNLELDWSFSAVQVSLPLTDWLPLAPSPLPPTSLNLDGFSFDAASAGGIYNASRLSAQHQVKAREPRLLPFWLAPR